MMKLWSVVLVAMLAFAHADADARRLGGGNSVGKQSSNVTQRESAAPGGPAQNANNAAKPAAPAAAPAAAAPKKPWGAMLGGLAAGLGLAWLASSLGLGAGFGNILMILLLAVAAFAIFKMVMRMRNGGGNQGGTSAGGSPFAFQGAGAATPAAAQVPAQYSPNNVGNDASARPWERNSMAFEAARAQPAAAGSGVVIGSGLGGAAAGAAALSGSQNWGVPEGFDTPGFLAAAKRNFVTLQAAWDRSDINTLRSMMTDSMLEEIRSQLAERETHRGAEPNHTDVVMIDAQLLGIEELDDGYMASVEFSGMIREEPSAGPSPFREVWNMTKSRSGASGWLVAGVQALQ